MWSCVHLALMLMSAFCQPSLAFSSHFDPGHWSSGQRGDGTPISELTWSSSLAVVAVSFSGLFTFIFLMLACLCCKKGDIGFKEPTSAVKHFSQKEFENNAGEDYPGDSSPHTTSSLQNGPEVYILPLTDVSLPVSSQPSTRPGHFLHPADLGRQSLLYLKEVGHGWFGKVFLGEVNISLNSCQVVVKELKVGASIQDQMRFLEEVQPYRSLQHPNLLQCLSQLTEVSPYLLVMEFCQLGDLKGYLRTHSAADELAPDPSTLQRMACEITSGLQHLHKHHYIHSDLALRNCLLSADLTVKLGDYGLSHNKYKQDYLVTPDQLWIPLRWIAPELIDDVHGNLLVVDQTKISNIWSLGVTLWELFEFGNQPYHRCSDKEVLTYTIKEQQLKLQKPLLNLTLSDRWYEVMQFCWLQPEQRPTADEVHLLLSYLCAKASSEVEEEFEKRWNAMKPGGGSSCGHATQLSSYPLLEQFGQDGFQAEVDDVLTVTETSQGLNFEYKWDRKPSEGFQPSPVVGLVQEISVGSQYQEIYFPSSASGRLSLSVSPICSNSFYESKQQCSLPQSLEPPGVVPVISAHSPSVTGEYYIRIEEPSDCNIELDYTMCSSSPDYQPWRSFQARDTLDNEDTSPTISLTMEPLLGQGQGEWERERERETYSMDLYPGDDARQSLLPHDGWRGGGHPAEGTGMELDPLGVSCPPALTSPFRDPPRGSTFAASYDELDETGMANGYQAAGDEGVGHPEPEPEPEPTLGNIEPTLGKADPLSSHHPSWHHHFPHRRAGVSEAGVVEPLGNEVGGVDLLGSKMGDMDLLGSETRDMDLLGSEAGIMEPLGSEAGVLDLPGSELAPRAPLGAGLAQRGGQDAGCLGGQIQADLSDVGLCMPGPPAPLPLPLPPPLQPPACKGCSPAGEENEGCGWEAGCGEGRHPLTVGCSDPLTVGCSDPLTVGCSDPLTVGCGDPLSSPPAHRGSPVNPCLEWRWDPPPAQTHVSRDEVFVDPLSGLVVGVGGAGGEDPGEDPLPWDIDIIQPPVGDPGQRGVEMAVTDLGTTGPPAKPLVQTLLPGSSPAGEDREKEGEEEEDEDTTSGIFTESAAGPPPRGLRKAVGTPDSLESLDIPSTGSSCDTFSPTSHCPSLQPRGAADSGYDTENFESPEFVLKEPVEQKEEEEEEGKDHPDPDTLLEDETPPCRDSAYFSDYDAEPEHCQAPGLERGDAQQTGVVVGGGGVDMVVETGDHPPPQLGQTHLRSTSETWETQPRCNSTHSLALALVSTDIEEIHAQPQDHEAPDHRPKAPDHRPKAPDHWPKAPDHRPKAVESLVDKVDYFACRQMFDGERVGFSSGGLVRGTFGSDMPATLAKTGGHHHKVSSGCIFDGTELILEEPGNQRVGFWQPEAGPRKFQPYSLNVEERLERCIVPKMQLVQLTLELPPLALAKDPPFMGEDEEEEEEEEEEEGEEEEEEEEESDDSDEELRIYSIQEDSEEEAPAVPIVVTDKDDGRNLRSLLKLPNLLCDTFCDDLERKKKAVSFYDDVTVYLFDQESPTVELSEQNIPDVDPARPHPPDHMQDKSSNICVESERQKASSNPAHRNDAEESGGFEWDHDFPLVSAKSSLVTDGSVLAAVPASADVSPGPGQGQAHQTSRFSRFTVSPATLSRFSITHVSDSDVGLAGGSSERGERE
ncbi:LOW QUALITY PROTEIN: serine/threonine-protein kinase LMTK1 [Rhinoraja longicauda]